MFSQKIIHLAQAATSTDINQNLQNTENQLQNLNASLDLLKEEYNAALNQPSTYSFFNLDNIYFWFVLAGLLLLAFGLLFLLAELQSNKNKKEKVVGLPKDKLAARPVGIIYNIEDEKPAIEIKKEAPVETKKPLTLEKKPKIKPEPKTTIKPTIEPKPKKAKTGPIKIKVEKVK